MLKLIKSFLSSPRSAPRRISRSRRAKCGREVSLLESRCLLSGVYSIAADSMAASRLLDAPLRTGQAAIVQGQLYFAAGWQNELAFEAPLNQLWVTNGTSSGSRHLKTFFGEISELTAVGTTLFFSVDDGLHGTELWKTDGTPVGTVLVRDVSAGQAASWPSRLTAVSDALYFTADDGVHGRELWRSDGTASGTQLVADIAPGTQGSDPGELTAWGRLIAFTAATPGFGRELWTSGGLAATTQPVRDIHSGSSDSSPANLRVFGSDLYFSANDGTRGHELWKSDGTTGGTTLVRDIAAGHTGSSPREFSIFGNQLVFTADDGIHGRELWKTDGNDSGTSLIADLNFGRDSSDPEGFVVAGGLLFFAADDGIHGREIWKSDATNAGSVMLRDLEPGEFGSGPTDLTVLNNSVYFVAWDSINGRELRITDGTPERTGLLNNLAPGRASAFFNRQALWKLNGNLLFASIDEQNIDHLWITDGTPLGTARLGVAPPTTLGAAPSDLIVLGNEVIYAATDAVRGRELWISNGTEIGTRLLADLNPGLADSSASQPVLVDGSVFFIAETKDYGQELWKTNGTSSGTTLVADIRPGSASSVIRSLTAVGSTLFFVADNGVLGPELWKSDGTSSGTVPVVDLRIGSEGSNPEQLTALNGTLFFTANNGVVGKELWASNGTAAGTALVLDVRPGAAGSTIQELTTHAGMLFFTADNGSQGREIWKSSGTTATTSQIIDLRTGSLGSDPRQLTSSSSRLYFTANDGASGVELWSTDGSAAGTTQVADIRPGSSSSLPEQLIVAADRLCFTAHDGVHGRELWTAGAGSPAANLLADLTPGPIGSEIILHAASTAHLWYSQYSFLADSQALWKIDLQSSKRERLTSVADDVGSDLNLVMRGSDAVFTADDGVRGTELWISDGTVAGTRLVADSNRSNGGSQPAEMLTVGNRVIYTSDDGTYGRELWISDGTPAGTRLLADLNRGSGSSNPEQLTLINGVVFFTADDGLSGRELWKTDTTTAGTVRVRDIRSGSASSAIHSLTRVGSTLFFVADDGSSGAEVWKSNGTTAGTTRVTDLRTGAVGSNPRHLTALNELIYFTADDGASGSELWRSDGSSAGTSLVRDVRAGALGSAISELAVHANRLYFVADDGNTGAELWVSDGQASGTRLVTDLATGASGSFPAQLTSTPDRLYFTAGTAGTGTELWSTDGSAQGTSLVADLRPGSASASPAQLRAVGGRLFFSADDPVHGRELRVTNAAGNAVLLLADLTPGTASTTFVDPVPFGSCLLVSVYNQANTGQPLLINADGVINVPLPAQNSQLVRNASRFSGTENAVFFSGTSDSHATELYHLRNTTPQLDALAQRQILEDAAEQSVSLSGITAGGGESQALRVTTTSSNTALVPNPTISYTSPAATGTLKFQPTANRSGTATITVTVEDGGLDNDLATAADNATFARQFVVEVTPVNDLPTLGSLNSLSVAEDSGTGSVSLSGIAAGGGESQVLRVFAASSNATLIATPAVTYSSPSDTGTLQFTPSANLSGEATITVTVEDGGLDDNLATTADNAVASRSFVLTVTPVNDPPTLDALNNMNLNEDASEQTVSLTGISAGGGESQTLRVTATSSNLVLIPNPTVAYTSANSSGSLWFQPVQNTSGSATITVSVEDGGLDNNLNTTADNGLTTRTFLVTVGATNDLPTLDTISAVTIAEDTAEYSVNLTGITAGGGETQPLRVTAASQNASLLSTLAVDYTSANTTGTLRLRPTVDASGIATIVVRVEDGGLDGDLSTVADNAFFTRSFQLTVEARNDAPTLNSLSDLTIAEDSGSHTVSLAGISAGGGESQTLRVTASSSVPDLLSEATVTYTSPNTTGFLRLQPMLNASAQAFITVRVEDAGADNNLQTTSDNAWSEQRFLLTVTPVNDSPTIDAVANIEIQEDSGDQTILLTGITAGAGESQSIRVTATSSDTLLFADPQVTHVSAETTARLKFRPEDQMFGDATITVTVEDGGLDNDLSTAADNATTMRTITVSVKSVNDAPTLDPVADITINEDSGLQAVELTGIGPGDDPGEVFRVRAVSSNWKLVPDPSIEVSRLFGNGVMSFTPVRDQFGTAEITISVEDGGDDDKLSTPDDNRTFSRTLRLTVLPVNDPPTIRQVDDLVVSEDCGEVLVDLKRITAGEGESQPIRLSAIGTPRSVIEAVSLSWNSPEPIGTLRFRPVKDAFGHALLRVIVEDGGDDADLGTRGDNLSFEMSFHVTVTPVNDTPTLDLISDVAIDEDTATFEVPVAGITAGGAEQQSLRITAISADRTLVPDPQVVYSSANANGSLVFSPVSHQYGTASITVVVEDAGFDGDFATQSDNARMVREFAVHIRPINDPPYFLPLSDIVLPEDFSPVKIPLEGVSSGFNESDLLRVFASAEPAGIVTIQEVTLSGAAGCLVLLPVADQSGRTVITVKLEDAGLDRDFLTTTDNLSLTRTFSVGVRPVNDKPTLDPVNDVVLNEDSAEYAIDLSGITAGGGETQPLAVTAVSNNPDLLSELSVLFVPGNYTATLKFHPLPNRYGSAVVSISVEDGGPDGRLDTRQDNACETRDFVVTISPVNDAPFVDAIPRLIVDEDSPETVVHLTGITAGPNEAQKIRISATSSNPSVVPDPAAQYNSAEVTGRLILKPAAEASGTSTITVTVEDSGLDGDLTTVSDNARFVREFEVVVDAVNDSPQMNPVADLQLAEDFGQYTIQLTGIGAGSTENQDLRITASVSAAELLGDLTIDYISPASTAVLTLRSLADRSGSAIVSIRLEDAGFDQDLATGSDNASRVYEFRLTVNPVNDPPTLKAPASLVISRNSPTVTLAATAIGAGPLEDQPLRVWASSSQPAIVKSVQVVYSAGADSATLSFAPVLNAVGSTTITVFVEDGGLDQDLQTLADNRTSNAAFSVTVVSNVPQITAPGATTVAQRPTLSWTTLPDAVAYEVWMRNATTGANPFYQAVSDTNSHAISRDLGIGSMELWVRGVRRDGSLMPWTPTYRFNVVTPPVVAAISTRQQTARPTISWNSLTPAAGYDIWLTNASSGQSQFVRKTISGTSWTPDEDLPIGRYYFWVRGTAANAFFTNWSQRIIFDVVPIPTAIRPTVSTFSRRPTFEWSAPVGATSYGIQVRSSVTGQYIVDLRNLNEPRWTPSVDLEAGTYAWWGVAYSAQAGFYSSWTRRIEFFVGGRSQVIAPESPSVSASPRIEWTRVEDVDYYVLWVNSGTQGAKFIYETGLSAPAYQVPVQLQRGVKYRVWVQAVSLTGEVGPWSPTYEFTVASDQVESSDSDIPESQLALLAPNLQNNDIRDIPKFPDDHVNSWDTASTNPATETPFPLTTLNSANQPEIHQPLKSAVASEAAQTDELRLLDMVFENTVFEMLEIITAPA